MNNTYREIAQVLEGAQTILLYPHVSADGDALGSCAALCRALRMKGKEAFILVEEELPLNLFDAVKELEADQYICDTLGKHASSKYIEAKYAEWDEYRRQITNWEIDQYLYKI